MEEINPLEREHSLCVILPAGIEKNITVHGSKPVMDLLVTLCANYHLNPSDYTVEFLSPNKNNISFKPNSPIGLLEAEKILLKPKGTEEKTKKPYMPEATVRLLINYNKSHKTVLRVNPRLPLETVLPAVCDKCEFNVETTVLLRDLQSKEALDLTKTLNDHGLREVFAKDTAAQDSTDCQSKSAGGAGTPTEIISPTPSQDLQRKERKQRKRGFFSFFRRRKKKNETNGSVSAPTSPRLGKQVRVRGNSESVSSTNTLPADTPKKRPAPQPPVAVSHSVPSNLSTCCIQGAQSSGESTLRSTKRRAPPPPCANAQYEQREETDVEESLKTLEELKETDDSLSSSNPSLTRLHEAPDSYRPSFRGRDISDARSALAKVLTSSVSKGTLVRRLRNSAAFPNFNVTSCVSTTSKCLDDRDPCAERESVFRSNLPTESEWTEPDQRTGWTTFKVVPLKKPASSDQEMMHDTQDRSELPVIDDKETTEKRKEEEEPEVTPAPVDDCDGETANDNSENQSEFGLSPNAGMVPCSSCIDEKVEEDVSHEEDEEAVFPPPPPPVVFTEDMETVEKEDSQASPILNGHTNAFSIAHNNVSSTVSDQTTVTPSRFAQAVALAVQRARLQRLDLGVGSGPQASGGPNGTLPSHSRSSYQYGA
ncbi:cordon-bleu protein-like 1 isoform X1 [Poecilia formosa]|uniref:cordon-bleu protein-like 1 isoform X1 n=1 Tax=Poecilia formosa TaxID=48698 RepID=UPI0007B84163|nr:PREDICTED: cordon-bleu protein-like 1 isoform X1 [Poecilia formosa]XP_016533658.1 PREDICTED: cordon-bleu protein-like 1 isoform X1 [Poecilia formosa]